MSDARSIVPAAVSYSTTGTHAVYTVPAGKILILKRVVVLNNSASAGKIQVYSERSGVYGFLINVGSVASGTAAEFNGLHNMAAGDILQMFNAAQPAHIWLSGSLLTA